MLGDDRYTDNFPDTLSQAHINKLVYTLINNPFLTIFEKMGN